MNMCVWYFKFVTLQSWFDWLLLKSVFSISFFRFIICNTRSRNQNKVIVLVVYLAVCGSTDYTFQICQFVWHLTNAFYSVLSFDILLSNRLTLVLAFPMEWRCKHWTTLRRIHIFINASRFMFVLRFLYSNLSTFFIVSVENFKMFFVLYFWM